MIIIFFVVSIKLCQTMGGAGSYNSGLGICMGNATAYDCRVTNSLKFPTNSFTMISTEQADAAVMQQTCTWEVLALTLA
jgi:hypothetical protein